MEQLRERIRQARISKGYTQKQLSEKTGVSEIAIRTLETGYRDVSPNFYTVYAIAKELGISIDWLCGLEESK